MSRALGFVTPTRAYAHEGRIYIHVAAVAYLERLTARYNHPCWRRFPPCAPIAPGGSTSSARGDPDYQARLEQLAAAPALQSRVAFHGYVPYGAGVTAHLRAGDVLVLPSLSKGTPHVLVEARANGLPCVATRVGGVPSVVIDGVDALLVPARDPAALAAAIARVVDDGSLRRSLIRNGLSRARQQTVDAFVNHLIKALGDGERRAPAAAR